MIRLNPHPCPTELTPALQAALTAEYQADTSKSVWNKQFIREALMLMSGGKCCYCECLINEESKYLEVEHFLPKSLFPLLVVAWHNLLPACKRCNIAKHNHNTETHPIVHPVNDEPRQHIYYNKGWIEGKTALGKLTVKVVDLNDLKRQKIVEKRYEIGLWLHDELDRLEDIALDFQNGVNNSDNRKHKIINKVKVLLREASPSMAYAATSATELLNDPLYPKVKSILQACHIWDDEMNALEATARGIALDSF